MKESYLTGAINRMIKEEFPEAWFYKASDMTQCGIPDRIGCMYGQFFAIEDKLPGGRVSKIQEYVMQKIAASGGNVCVAKSVDEARQFLGNIKSNRFYKSILQPDMNFKFPQKFSEVKCKIKKGDKNG